MDGRREKGGSRREGGGRKREEGGKRVEGGKRREGGGRREEGRRREDGGGGRVWMKFSSSNRYSAFLKGWVVRLDRIPREII